MATASNYVSIPQKINFLGINVTYAVDNFYVNPQTGVINILDDNKQPIYTGNGPTSVYTVTDPTQRKLVLEAYNKQVGQNIFDPNTGRPLSSSAPTTNNPQNGTNLTSPPSLSYLNNPLSSENLSYPTDLQKSKDRTYLVFKSYDYSSIQKQTNQIFNVGSGPLGSLLTELTTVTQSIQENPTGIPSAYSKDKISMYVPPNINVGYGANWGEGSLSLMGTKIQGDDYLSQIMGAVTNALGQSSADMVSKVMSKLPQANITGEQLIGLTTGLIYNRNEFSTFSNMNMRTFNYSFLMVGRDRTELDNIYQIINAFKIGMHPKSGASAAKSGSDITRAPVLKYPKIWTIEYNVSGQSHNFLPKTKYCGLVSMNINYTPNGVFTTLANAYDYKIPAVQVDLGFKELTPLIADEIISPSVAGPDFGKADASPSIGTDYSTNGATF